MDFKIQIAQTKKYMKLEEGENSFRVVSKPVQGYVDWKDKKPYRYRVGSQPKESFNPEMPMKGFLAFYVWDYAKEDLFILEITQKGIINSIASWLATATHSDITSFDIKVMKSGTGNLTKYMAVKTSPKKMASHIEEAAKDTPVNLEALFEGLDPWRDFYNQGTFVDMDFDDKQWKNIEQDPFQKIMEKYEQDGLETSHLAEYLEAIASKKGWSLDQAIESALQEGNVQVYQTTYIQFLKKKAA